MDGLSSADPPESANTLRWSILRRHSSCTIDCVFPFLCCLAVESDSEWFIRLSKVATFIKRCRSVSISTGFVPWSMPNQSRDPQCGIQTFWTIKQKGKLGYGSLHPGIANVIYLDGAVRSISTKIDPSVLKTMSEVIVDEN